MSQSTAVGVSYRAARPLGWVIVIGLLLRVLLVGAVANHPERYIQSDGIGYDRIAQNLVTQHAFSMGSAEPYVPDNFRTPGYPVTVAAIYAAFGYRPDLVLWLQVTFGTLTILATYWLGARIGGATKAGVAAAGFLAVSPHSITYTALLWSDTEYTLLLTLTVALVLLMTDDPTPARALAAGALGGLATLVHPRSLYLPWLICGFLCLNVRRIGGASLRTSVLAAVVFLSCFSAALAPWRLRNAEVFGVPNVTSAAGVNMLYYGAALTEAYRTGQDHWAVSQRYDRELRAMSQRQLNEAEMGILAWRVGLEKIAHDPISYATVHVAGMLRTLMPGTLQIATLLTGEEQSLTSQVYGFLVGVGRFRPFSPSSAPSLPLLIYVGADACLLLVLYALSAYALVKHARLPAVCLLGFILLYLLAVAGPAGAPRFRVVMMPMLCVLAAIGLVSFEPISRRMNEWRL